MNHKIKKKCYLIVNFGGPRSIAEIHPFLEALLTDKDVIRTNMPHFLQDILFKRIARKRSMKIAKDYEAIGGKSPIYADTEAVAEVLRNRLDGPVITFHRYLPETHSHFLKQITEIDCDEIVVFPMFPQFTYATTGSVARWFEKSLPREMINKMRWIKSYADHPSFVKAHVKQIESFLEQHELQHDDVVLLFSSHGIPVSFVETGDVYEKECQDSFKAIMKFFPEALGRLAYQSKFGPEEWIKPYTIDVCEDIKGWSQGRNKVVFVPVSFTSDHIETLYEIENEYMSVVRAQGLEAFRVPCLTLNEMWIQAILDIVKSSNFCGNQMLIRA